MDALSEFVEIKKSRDKLAEEDKRLAARQRDLESVLLEEFADGAVDNMKVAGVTVYRASNLRISVPADKRDAAVRVAESNGWDGVVSPNSAKIGALVREFAKTDDGYDLDQIPDDLRDVVSVFEQQSLRVVRK